MNIRKIIDYSKMFVTLDSLMSQNLQQLDLFLAVGKEVDSTPEKGAAVAASEYIKRTYPRASGFSPRNVRRMRDFYHAYKDTPDLLNEALKIGWTHNMVILETCVSNSERLWYIRAVQKFGWSKQTLATELERSAYQNCLDEKSCCDGCEGKLQKPILCRYTRKMLHQSVSGRNISAWPHLADIRQYHLQERSPPKRSVSFCMYSM